MLQISSELRIKLLLALLLFNAVSLLQAFVNSPKIITKDGNLIFESGLNRNISFRLSGNSRININNEYDLLDLIFLTKKGRNSSQAINGWSEADDAQVSKLSSDVAALKLQVLGENGLDKRLRRLQNRTRTANQVIRRFQSRLGQVETKVQDLHTRLELDSCKSNPCENGGTCYNIYNGFMCKCTSNFEGTTCDKDVNECALFVATDLGCQNGGQCVNQFGGYNCICTPGWFGIHCTQRKGDCLQSSTWELCKHGTCVNNNDNNFGYKCICDQGWKTNDLTPACTVDVDECQESHPRCATKCINLQGSFSCAPCDPGLTGNGINCRDINECETHNGGCSLSPKVACINSYGSFHCGECPLGWIGDGRTCVRNSGNNENGQSTSCAGINICHPEAICTEISNTVVCTCPNGMIGSGIGANGCVRGTANNCNSVPCANGGTCIDVASGYVCVCPIGFREPDCTPIASPCTPNPCHNSGRCLSLGGTQFQCQCASGYSGRLCDNRFSRCGGLLVGDVGHLKYPEGSLYEHNAQCAWVIRTNETLVLNVTFSSFELEDVSECRFDWLQINDGRTAAAQILGRFCGSHKPMGGNIISTTNHLYLWFRSDNSTARAGFELEWHSISPQCGGLVEFESHGTISTPGSPGNYPKNRDCRWLLRAPNNKRIKLTFFSLQIENHDSCNFDFVEIVDAVSHVTIQKFCNSSHPTPLLLPTHEASIHFHSDNEGGDTGFQIYYSVEERMPGCGGTFTAKEGTIKSPVSLTNGPLSCEYDIRMSTSESIIIEFIKFEMASTDCVELYDLNSEKLINVLQAKYCGGVDIGAISFHSSYNVMQVKYYTEGEGSFELKYKADCSYKFESDSDIIESPNYPKLSNADRLCSYTISTEPNTVISVNVVDFELKDSSLEDSDCAYTYLTINDGLDKSILGPFCGNVTPPHDFVSKTNMLILNFQSGVTSSGRGFKIEYRSIPMGKTDCGGVYTKPGHNIRLPTGDDGTYLHEMECYWVIMAPMNKDIVINWKYFNLEQTTDCSFDYVEIYDNLANRENDKPLGRYCSTPPSFVTQSRIITIKFVSDYSDASDGFEATFDFVENSGNCGGEIHSSIGRITSPAFPANYTNDMDCIWIITAPYGTQIELQMDSFELEQSENCVNDWLEIKNGGSVHSASVGTYCGKNIPHVLPSFTNQMYLHFHADSFINARGFKIKWYVFSNGCGGTLSSARGVITSPRYPNEYPQNAECEWLIHVHKGSSIHLTVEDLQMEDLFECSYDYLAIFEGHSNVDLPLGKICKLKEDTPMQFITTSNEALIRFQTDSSNNERGFLLSYYANCTRSLTDMFGIIESPNFGESFYKNEAKCRWEIKAPKGNHIELELTYFETYEKGDSLYFSETTVNGTVTREIEQVQSFNSTGDTLIVIQNSSLVNFRLEYSIVGCVQILHRDTGEFQSPNFPRPYPGNVECVWEIKAPLGKGITLTVEELDIEESVNCTNDALQISSHANSNNPKEKHCGKSTNLVTTSSGHHMFIRFFSDSSNNAKGFKARYETSDSKCGGIFESKHGVLHSPNYPLNYPPNSDCEWTIQVSDHHTITFVIEELDMEDNYYYNCEMDYVEVTEYIDDEENLIFRLCGDLNSQENTYNTTSNVATVRFKTDDSIESKGFKISYKENCGGRVVINDGDYQYLEIERHSQTNDSCEWQLLAKDLSKHIVFSPGHIQLNPLATMLYPTEEDCTDIGVKIYDGSDDKSPLRSKFCKTHPPAIISNGHALTVKIPLNIISEFSGSYTLMESYCENYYDSLNGKFSSPYYPSSYPINIDCDWHITASLGNSILLTIESLDLEDSEGCNNDYLEVRELNERGRLLGLFCGTTVPPPLEAVQSLWVRFSSDGDNVGDGFLASYNYASHNEINGTKGNILSPKYPSKFESIEPYSWRITVERDFVILLAVNHVIDTDIAFIKLYDGYSDIGVQIDYSNTHVVRSSMNILYIRATKGPFEFEWERLSKEAVQDNRTAEEVAKVCGKQVIPVDVQFFFNSPGYPEGYGNNLNCSWIFVSSNPASHVVFQLMKVDLEEFADCFADYVAISTSNDLVSWKQVDKLCAKPLNIVNLYHGAPYLKLEFVTDSGINKTGFSSFVKTSCGSELTDRTGFVNITGMAIGANIFQMECVWTIRVRQSRRIRITFIDSYIRNMNETSTCRTFFVARNGINEDSPFLGKGKYCDNNITDILDTTSNRAYIKFVRVGFPKFKASFHFEEISNECSDDITLMDTPFDRLKTITSPNYPNIPNPHTECVWKINAPFHHIIAVDFVGTFDLAKFDSGDCDREYVQLNDGSTEIMPIIGKYCGTTKPNSVRTTGNMLRIKYFTDVSEPHAGFKVNVSIGRCGGAYHATEGVINSPETLMLPRNELEFECVYIVELEEGSTMSLHLEKMELPGGENCSAVTHLELQEIYTEEGMENVTDILRLCGENYERRYIVETNKLIIKYKIKGAPSSSNTFKINYAAIGSRCGETIEARLGILQTPGYPNGVSRPTHCVWRLRAPRGRRIRIDFLDFDTGGPLNANTSIGRVRTFRGRLTFANDFQMTSIIARISENPPTHLYSTDNTMAIDAFLLSFSRHRGFKLRFSSDEDSVECRDNIDLNSNGVIRFKGNNDTDMYCSYYLNHHNTLALHIDKYEQNSQNNVHSVVCTYISPLKLMFGEQQILPDLLCKNETHPSVRLPFPIMLILSGNKRNKLIELDIRYSIHKCGGIHPFFENLTITQPNMGNFSGTLECAWAIWPNNEFSVDDTQNYNSIEDSQIEITLTTDFKGRCEDQYLQLYNGPNQNAPHLGRYCSLASATNLIVEHGFFFEYYSSNYETNSTFNLTIKQGSGCGGVITYPYREIIFSEQYKDNIECIWEIIADTGFHVGLSFVDRFFIESSTDCKKDYLKIQEKNISGDWTDLKTICGRDPPAAINTTTTRMRLIFRSDSDTVGDGFTAHFERNCGGVFYAEDEMQKLSSPGYPNQYGHLLLCNYTFISKNQGNTGVFIRFLDFEIEQPPIRKCLFDNVTVITEDETDNIEEKVLCGYNKHQDFRAKKKISVILRTDHSFASKGFLLEYNNNICGGRITNSTVIHSPKQFDTGNFPHNSNCVWNLTAPEGYKIIIKFAEIDYESQAECSYDAVEVYYGLAAVENQRMGRFCGNLTGNMPSLSIPTNKALIRSFSDFQDASKGFRAFIQFMPNCDKHIFLGSENSTYEFDAFARDYVNNMDCSYVFTTTSGRQFLIDFSLFHIEETTNCLNDYLDIRDGAGPFSDSIGQFCGHILPTRLMTSRNALFIRFASNTIATSSGFKATITSSPLACGNYNMEIKENQHVVLKSPDDGNGKYRKNLNCIWRIKSTKTIHLKFDKLDLEEPDANGTCLADYIKIYNADDAEEVEKGYANKIVFNGHFNKADWLNFATEHIYCGSGIPDDYFPNSKNVIIKFKTDETNNRAGFSLTATTINGCFRNFTGTQGRIQIAETSDHCDVYITAPSNYSLSLYYADVSFSEYDCESEYVEVFDAHTNSSLQKLCQYTEPGKSLYSNTNTLRLRIKMNSYYTQFDMTYLGSQDGPGCGGDLFNTAGVITSPFYPNNIRNNSDCRWNIRVPNNVRVLLKFDVFDLGAKATCHSDYLQIIERNSDGIETVMRQFCGEDNPKVYKSEKSFVIVRFHKTVNYDGTGWVIKFNGVYANYKIPDYYYN